MLVHQLVVLLLGDEVGVSGSDRDVFAPVVRVVDQLAEHYSHVQLHVLTVFESHGAGQRVLVEVSSGSDAHGDRGESEFGEV